MSFPKITDNHKYFIFLIIAVPVIWYIFPGDVRYFIGLFFAIAVMFFGVGKKLDRIHDDLQELEAKIKK